MTHATDRYRSLLELTPQQALAVDALTAGATHADAAQVAGVDRTTVSRWATRHPAFIAEVNRRRLERAEATRSRVEILTMRSIELVAAAINDGDAALAMQWLRIHGTSSGTAIPALLTHATDIIEERRLALPDESGFEAIADGIADRSTERAVDAIVADLDAGPDDHLGLPA
jgi:hypothetical protein